MTRCRPWAPALLVVSAAACGGAPTDSAPADAGASGAAAAEVRTIAEIPGGTGGLELGADGALYSSEFGDTLGQGPVGTRVFRITMDGAVEEWAGGFDGASGNLFDAGRRFLQSNIRGNTVTVLEPDGTRRDLDIEGLVNPVGLIQGADGAYYVANCGGNTVGRFTLDGQASQVSADPLLRCPNGIAAAPGGSLYVSNFYNGDVVRLGADGAASRLATLPGDNNGHLVYGNGVLYVAARAAGQIYEVTLDGEVTLLAGTGERGHDDGPALEATLSLPNDLALSVDGRTLYFNEVVPTDDPTGTRLTPTLVRALVLPVR